MVNVHWAVFTLHMIWKHYKLNLLDILFSGFSTLPLFKLLSLSQHISRRIEHSNRTTSQYCQLRGKDTYTKKIRDTPAGGGWHPLQKQPYPLHLFPSCQPKDGHPCGKEYQCDPHAQHAVDSLEHTHYPPTFHKTFAKFMSECWGTWLTISSLFYSSENLEICILFTRLPVESVKLDKVDKRHPGTCQTSTQPWSTSWDVLTL
jgi:hypothetical protein